MPPAPATVAAGLLSQRGAGTLHARAAEPTSWVGGTGPHCRATRCGTSPASRGGGGCGEEVEVVSVGRR
jgi:hypothetical protein